MGLSWLQQTAQSYNNFAWVKNTQCSGKVRFRSVSHALKTNLAKDHKSFRRSLADGGVHRSLTAVYLCPHCGHYHNGGRYKQLFTVDILVICSKPIIGKLASTGSTPSSRRARSLWDNRKIADNDAKAHRALINSGYAKANLPHPELTLYWMYDVVLPAEEAVLWLLKTRLPDIEWFVPNELTSKPIDLYEYS